MLTRRSAATLLAGVAAAPSVAWGAGSGATFYNAVGPTLTCWRADIGGANLTRQDGLDFLKIAPLAGIRTQTTAFPLAEANEVLTKLRTGQILGAAVLKL